MTHQADLAPDFRARILEEPDMILSDPQVMRALIAARDQDNSNVIDLRGLAMDRLEARLARLEETHRNVIAAAYENLAGTNQIHRAVLKLLDAERFEDMLNSLGTDLADMLRVDSMVLVLESRASGREESSLARYHEVLTVAPEGFVSTYVDQGRGGPPRPVTLRQIHPDDGGVIHTIHGTAIYGDKSPHLRSEACIRLDLGAGRLPGMLAMGCEDPHQFTPQQGADLLTFFGGVFERTMRRWLS